MADVAVTDWISAVGIVVTAGITAVYVYLTYRLAREAKRTADISSVSTEVALRAAESAKKSSEEAVRQRQAASAPLIGIESCSLAWHGESLVSLEISARNFGGGPAFGVRVDLLSAELGGVFAVLEGVLAAGSSSRMRLSSTWRIPPGATVTCTAHLKVQDLFGDVTVWIQELQLTQGRAKAFVASSPSADR